MLIAENTDGTIVKVTPDSVGDGKAVFTVGDLRSFAVQTIRCPLGDVDGNGEVEVIDATILQRYDAMIDISPITEDDLLARADVDGDGEITIVDVTFIQRYLAGMNVKYPIGEYSA